VQCQSCHAAARDGSRFCPSCGRPLVDADAVTRLAQPASPATFGATRPARDVLDITGLPTGGADVAHTSIDAGTLLAGRYRVQRLLGRGGMVAVYLADDLRLKQQVALKLLPAELARDPK
jgi:serine/threonine-protein kinase